LGLELRLINIPQYNFVASWQPRSWLLAIEALQLEHRQHTHKMLQEATEITSNYAEMRAKYAAANFVFEAT